MVDPVVKEDGAVLERDPATVGRDLGVAALDSDPRLWTNRRHAGRDSGKHVAEEGVRPSEDRPPGRVQPVIAGLEHDVSAIAGDPRVRHVYGRRAIWRQRDRRCGAVCPVAEKDRMGDDPGRILNTPDECDEPAVRRDAIARVGIEGYTARVQGDIRLRPRRRVERDDPEHEVRVGKLPPPENFASVRPDRPCPAPELREAVARRRRHKDGSTGLRRCLDRGAGGGRARKRECERRKQHDSSEGPPHLFPHRSLVGRYTRGRAWGQCL